MITCVAGVWGCGCSPLSKLEAQRLEWIESTNRLIRCPFVEAVKAQGIPAANTMRDSSRWLLGALSPSPCRGVVYMKFANLEWHGDVTSGEIPTDHETLIRELEEEPTHV